MRMQIITEWIKLCPFLELFPLNLFWLHSTWITHQILSQIALKWFPHWLQDEVKPHVIQALSWSWPFSGLVSWPRCWALCAVAIQACFLFLAHITLCHTFVRCIDFIWIHRLLTFQHLCFLSLSICVCVGVCVLGGAFESNLKPSRHFTAEYLSNCHLRIRSFSSITTT